VRLRSEAKECLNVCCSCIDVSLSLVIFKAVLSLSHSLSLSLSLSMGALPGEPERRDPLLGTLENT